MTVNSQRALHLTRSSWRSLRSAAVVVKFEPAVQQKNRVHRFLRLLRSRTQAAPTATCAFLGFNYKSTTRVFS
jgi:hypothetical protein